MLAALQTALRTPQEVEVIPTILHVLGRISPIFPPFFPVFCALSPSRRGGSNEPQAETQGQETAGKGTKTRDLGPSFDTPDAVGRITCVAGTDPEQLVPELSELSGLLSSSAGW